MRGRRGEGGGEGGGCAGAAPVHSRDGRIGVRACGGGTEHGELDKGEGGWAMAVS